jgi:hypothetical protein
MPLRALRPGRSDQNLKRRSTLDPANFFKRGDKDARVDDAGERPEAGRIAVSEDGRRPTSSEVVRPSTSAGDDEPPSLPVQAATPNTRRFSMMRFRHASDSQLSTRAKEQAARDRAPPLPATSANQARMLYTLGDCEAH